jgi:hypothetical protein
VENETSSAVDRRRLLRRAGAVAAGVGAAGVVAALDATPAHAAPGSPVLAGQAVDAATSTTTITNNSATNATLALGNATGASLELAPRSTTIPLSAPQGSFNATTFGDLEYMAGPEFPAVVYTSFNATQTWPIKPFRALDTRGLGGVNGGNGRELILNPEVLNSAGKLRAGSTLRLNLTGFVADGWGVIGTLTVLGPEGNGFVTVFPGGTGRPNTAAISFLSGWSIANNVLTGLGQITRPSQTDVIEIFSPVTTHVVFDVSAFIVASIDHIDPGLLPFGPAAANAKPGTSRADKVRAYKPAKR